MLKRIHPVVSPDLLHALASMGHGDTLALVDANFPAASIAATTHAGRPVALLCERLATAAGAIATLMPLDEFEPPAVVRMDPAPSGDVPAVQREAIEAICAEEADRATVGALARHEFYELAKTSFAIVATRELRPYGCLILKKGVIFAHDPGRHGLDPTRS